jgi:hypothetical protein
VLFLGDDRAEALDIELQDGDGKLLAPRRLPEGVAGIADLHSLVGDHLGDDGRPVAGDSAVAEHVKVAARAHQTLIWTRQRNVAMIRSLRNQRLADALYQQAFAALTSSPGARAFYDRQRARGATHHQALRALANRLVSILHGCLTHQCRYDETVAWPPEQSLAA